MSQSAIRNLETTLLWVAKGGIFIIPFLVLVVSGSLFFPYITLKNFLFRIIVEIIVASWIGLLIIDFKKYWPKWNVISIVLSIFVAILFLSAIFGVDFRHSFWSNFERMEGVITYLHLLALFFVATGIFRTMRDWIIIFSLSVAASVLVAFYGLLEYLGQVETFADGSRIISTLGNPLYVAVYLSFHLFLIAFLWFQSRAKILKWTLGVLFVFELAMFILTGSRGGFIGIMAGFGVVLLLWLFFTKNKKQKLILGAIIIVIASVPLVLNVFQDTSFIKGNPVLSRFSNISLAEQTVQSRFTIWSMALESFSQRPILGWGVGNFIVPYAKNYDVRMFGNEPWFDRTHNVPLEWLSQAGIFGFLSYASIFIAILWVLIYSVRQKKLHKNLAFIFVGMFVAYLVQMLFVFDTLPTYLMLILLLGFFYTLSLSGSRTITQTQRLSTFGIIGIVTAFLVVGLLIFVINVRPLRAAGTLIDSFHSLRQGQTAKAEKEFQKALLLSKGTVGTNEIREHITRTATSMISQSRTLENSQLKSLYALAIEEMEKEVSGRDKNLNIKNHILLAQLYGLRGFILQDREDLAKSVNKYRSILDFAPDYVPVWPLWAEVLLQSGNVSEALSSAKKLTDTLKKIDRYNEALYILPVMYVVTEQYDEAYKELLRLSIFWGGPEHKLNPQRITPIVRLARAGNIEIHKAIALLERMYRIDRSAPILSINLAEMHAQIGKKDMARFYAKEALALGPSPDLKKRLEQFLADL